MTEIETFHKDVKDLLYGCIQKVPFIDKIKKPSFSLDKPYASSEFTAFIHNSLDLRNYGEERLRSLITSNLKTYMKMFSLKTKTSLKLIDEFLDENSEKFSPLILVYMGEYKENKVVIKVFGEPCSVYNHLTKKTFSYTYNFVIEISPKN